MISKLRYLPIRVNDFRRNDLRPVLEALSEDDAIWDEVATPHGSGRRLGLAGRTIAGFDLFRPSKCRATAKCAPSHPTSRGSHPRAARIISEELSVRQAEDLAQELAGSRSSCGGFSVNQGASGQIWLEQPAFATVLTGFFLTCYRLSIILFINKILKGNKEMVMSGTPAQGQDRAPSKPFGSPQGRFRPGVGEINLLRALLVLGALIFAVSTVTGVNSVGWATQSGDGDWNPDLHAETEPDGLLVDLDPDELAIIEDGSLPPTASIVGLQAYVSADGEVRTLSLVGSGLTGLGVLGAVAVAWVVLTRAANGRLFESSNWKLLGVAAGAMMVAQIGSFVESSARMEALHALDLTVQSTVSVGFLIIGLIFAALARVWKVGSDLADDVALTV